MKNWKTLTLAALVALIVAAPLMAGVVCSDSKEGAYEKRTIQWFSETFTLAITATNSVTGGGVKILDGWVPEGHIIIHAAVAKDVTFSPTATNGVDGTDNGDFALGSAVGSGALTTTEVNIIPKTAQDDMTNVTDSVTTAISMIDGSSAAVDVYVNYSLDADVANAVHTNTVTTAGEAFILYSFVGDD